MLGCKREETTICGVRRGFLWMVEAARDTPCRVTLQITLAVTAILAAFGVFSGWRGARPPDPHRGPRLVPWRFLMLLSAAGVLLMAVHIVNLMGVTTGR